MSTLNSDPDNQDQTLIDDGDGASTSCDVLSLQFDETSIAASEDLSVYCRTLKKTKKIRSKEEKQLRDLDMWQASNVEVMKVSTGFRYFYPSSLEEGFFYSLLEYGSIFECIFLWLGL